jgi:hypothetical protein
VASYSSNKVSEITGRGANLKRSARRLTLPNTDAKSWVESAVRADQHAWRKMANLQETCGSTFLALDGRSGRAKFHLGLDPGGGSSSTPDSSSEKYLGCLWLPQAKRCAGRIDDNAKPAVIHHFCHVSHDRCAKRFCLLGRCGDVIDLDVS